MTRQTEKKDTKYNKKTQVENTNKQTITHCECSHEHFLDKTIMCTWPQRRMGCNNTKSREQKTLTHSEGYLQQDFYM